MITPKASIMKINLRINRRKGNNRTRTQNGTVRRGKSTVLRRKGTPKRQAKEAHRGRVRRQPAQRLYEHVVSGGFDVSQDEQKEGKVLSKEASPKDMANKDTEGRELSRNDVTTVQGRKKEVRTAMAQSKEEGSMNVGHDKRSRTPASRVQSEDTCQYQPPVREESAGPSGRTPVRWAGTAGLAKPRFQQDEGEEESNEWGIPEEEGMRKGHQRACRIAADAERKARKEGTPVSSPEKDISSDSGGDEEYVQDTSVAPPEEYISEEDEGKHGKRRKRKRKSPTKASPKQGPRKRRRQNAVEQRSPEGAGKPSVKREEPEEKPLEFQIFLQELNYPEARFSVPEVGGPPMIGLKSVGYQFNLQLKWENEEGIYEQNKYDCLCCRPCERPRCGLCAGCQAKPGQVRRSAHDVCIWKRCLHKAWRKGADMLKWGYPTNEMVLTRTWLKSVNTLCMKITDEDTKKAVRDRLAVYNRVLNMSWDEEREFWDTDPGAFNYPHLELPGGDKFTVYYKKLEFAQFKMAAYGRKLKVALAMETSLSFDNLQYDMDLRFRMSLEEEEPQEEREAEYIVQQQILAFQAVEITPLATPGMPISTSLRYIWYQSTKGGSVLALFNPPMEGGGGY